MVIVLEFWFDMSKILATRGRIRPVLQTSISRYRLLLPTYAAIGHQSDDLSDMLVSRQDGRKASAVFLTTQHHLSGEGRAGQLLHYRLLSDHCALQQLAETIIETRDSRKDRQDLEPPSS